MNNYTPLVQTSNFHKKIVVHYKKSIIIYFFIASILHFIFLILNKSFSTSPFISIFFAISMLKYPYLIVQENNLEVYSLIGIKKSYPLSKITSDKLKIYRFDDNGKKKRVFGKSFVDKKNWLDLINYISALKI